MKKISIPNERWQSQQRAARAKLARSEASDKEVEASAQGVITGREWLFQQEYPDQSLVQKAARDLAAKLEVTPADKWAKDPPEVDNSIQPVT